MTETPFFWIGLVGFISLVGALFLYKAYQQKLRIQTKELEASEAHRQKEKFQIQAITSSLNPHLINNSLSWIQARLQQDPEGMKVVDRLAENIETVFLHSRTGKAFHTLKDEMRLVVNYLQIQQARYGDYISVKLPEAPLLQKHATTNCTLDATSDPCRKCY